MKDSPIINAIECFLAALAKSPHYNKVVVRGSYATRLWMGDYRRPVHDLDLLYLETYSKKDIGRIVTDVLKESSTTQIEFDLSSVTFDEIWSQSLSPGVRVKINFIFDDSTLALQIDVAANDPLCDEPVEIALTSRSEDTIRFRTVSIETAAAWKLHGLFEHLNGAWMTKTLWDLYVICKTQKLEPLLFRKALELAFTSRLDPVECLRRLLYGDFGQSKKSKKRWKHEIGTYANGEIVGLEFVLQWLRDYLIPIVNLRNNGDLLTLSQLINYRVEALRRLNSAEALQKLKTLNNRARILKAKAYHSIPHLPESRKGPADRNIDKNKARMLTKDKLKESDIVIVQEKLDGSCVCAYRQGEDIIALGREGSLASESPNEGRRMWSRWVDRNKIRFITLLQPGERVVGEWLALAHGTKYKLSHEPFIAFDLFNGDNKPISQQELRQRCLAHEFVTPAIIHRGEPIDTDTIMSMLGQGMHGAVDLPEGAIWRLERNGRPMFSAKFVRHDKVDGSYLPENSGKQAIWNWDEDE